MSDIQKSYISPYNQRWPSQIEQDKVTQKQQWCDQTHKSTFGPQTKANIFFTCMLPLLMHYYTIRYSELKRLESTMCQGKRRPHRSFWSFSFQTGSHSAYWAYLHQVNWDFDICFFVCVCVSPFLWWQWYVLRQPTTTTMETKQATAVRSMARKWQRN